MSSNALKETFFLSSISEYWMDGITGHELEKALGDCEGQRSPVCYSPWGHKELDMPVTEQQQCLNSGFKNIP